MLSPAVRPHSDTTHLWGQGRPRHRGVRHLGWPSQLVFTGSLPSVCVEARMPRSGRWDAVCGGELPCGPCRAFSSRCPLGWLLPFSVIRASGGGLASSLPAPHRTPQDPTPSSPALLCFVFLAPASAGRGVCAHR